MFPIQMTTLSCVYGCGVSGKLIFKCTAEQSFGKYVRERYLSKERSVTYQRRAGTASPVRFRERQGGAPVPERHRSSDHYGERQYQSERQGMLVSEWRWP